jgi:hypothetical protein
VIFLKCTLEVQIGGCMKARYSQLCLALAVLTAPVAVSARSVQIAMPADSGSDERAAAKPAAFRQATLYQAGYNLAQRRPAAAALTPGSTHTRQAPISDRSLAVQGARYGDGEMEYIEGPSVSYQRSRKGPVFEAGALGGGMESAPFLAHVGVNWQF